MKNKNKKKFNITKKIVFFASIALILVLLICTQIIFNKFVWDSLKQKNVFNLRYMLVEAIRDTQDNSERVNEKGEIKETKLKLPDNSDIKFNNLRYTYFPKDDETIESPERMQISTDKLYNIAVTSIPYPSNGNFEEIFRKVPEAQACTRGFEVIINFFGSEDGSKKLILEKSLSDGRKIQIWREINCEKTKDSSGADVMSEANNEMDKLEKILIGIDSY